jgi:hypothetical protein
MVFLYISLLDLSLIMVIFIGKKVIWILINKRKKDVDQNKI